MNRNLFSLAAVLVAAFGLAGQTQVAEAQIYGGAACCDQPGYAGGYGYGGYGSYGYGSYGYGSGYGGYGYGYGGYGSYGCGGGYGYGSSCGLLGGCGFRRSWGYCDPPCGYTSYGVRSSSYGSYLGCGYGDGCYTGYRGCGLFGHRARYRRFSYCCNLSSGFTGAYASCCTPAPTTCCGMVSDGYTVQPGTETVIPSQTTPTPTLNAAPTSTPTPANPPTPTAIPTPANPPTPGT